MTDHPPQAPLAPVRRAYILDALARGGVIRSSQLIEELGVTPVTLRRDLAQMEQEGLLNRVHGGAVPADGADAGASGAPDGVAPGARGTIAVLVPSLSFYWPTVVRGIEAEARRQGFRVLLRGASYELQDERPALERLVGSEHVRGLIVAPNTDMPHAQEVVQWLAECGVPSVLAERDAFVLPGQGARRVGHQRSCTGGDDRRPTPRGPGTSQSRPRDLAHLADVSQDRGGMGSRVP